ncbi:MAG: calcium-binding protein [Aestuariivirga sp.]
MAVFVGNALNNIANATGAGTLIGFVGGNIALLQDAFGDMFFGFGGNDAVIAGNGNDVINGGDGNDFANGGAGNDIINAGNGNDTSYGGLGNDNINGGDGNDYVNGGLGLDVMNGGNGVDTMDVSFFAGNYNWNMTTGVTNFAGEFAFNFENARTGAGNDSITGTNGNNIIVTNAGNDIINALAGDDVLNGGAGADVMNGGAGFDDFDYNAVSDSTFGGIDVINGFQNIPFGAGAIDQIDLSTIDANPFAAGNQAFTFRDALPFNGVGQVRWFNAGANTIVDVNTDIDVAPEMRIVLTGVYNLDAVDFIL